NNDTQAQGNFGYIANSTSEMTLTLPTSLSLSIGDLVRILVHGVGNVSITPNLGQTFQYGGGLSTAWTRRDPARAWRQVASSADGSKLVGVVLWGQIYTSTDFGLTWAPHESVRNWTSVASSADGTKLVATAASDWIYTSTDSGLTWTPRESPRSWTSVASSA